MKVGHRPCLVCETQNPAVFNHPRERVCVKCRPDYELQRTGRACFLCQRFQPQHEFPILAPDAEYRRRTPYCLTCIDSISQRVANNERPTTLGRELGMNSDTIRRLYEFWRQWHPEAPPISRWPSTRINSRGQMVRNCSGCNRVLVVKDENFYVSHPNLPETSPQRWDYACRRCRTEQAAAYNRDKRLQGDPVFRERRRKAQQRWIENNPERAREARQRHRERKRRGEVVPMHERRTHDNEHPRVERQPFLDWIKQTIPKYPGVTEFADLIGIPPRTLLRLRSDGGRWVELDTVDRALQREGGWTTLMDLYPHLYDEGEEAA